MLVKQLLALTTTPPGGDYSYPVMILPTRTPLSLDRTCRTWSSCVFREYLRCSGVIPHAIATSDLVSLSLSRTGLS